MEWVAIVFFGKGMVKMVSYEQSHWHPTVAEVDLGAIRRNVRVFRSFVKDKTHIMAVVKADGYGHGSAPVARAALAGGAHWLGVTIPEEALRLREDGIDAPILVLGATQIAAAEAMISLDISLTVFDPDCLEALQREAQRQGKRAKVHLKLDTGMHRIGVMEDRELVEILERWKACPDVEMEGVFSHFAAADERDLHHAKSQLLRFQEMVKAIHKAGYAPMLHMCNTAGAIAMPEVQFDMVRLGIGLYGYAPSPEIGAKITFIPAMTVRSALTRVFTLRAGESIGYGCTYTADQDMQVGTIPIGYGDGYRRVFSGRGQALLGGRYVSLLGRICMDQCMVDISKAPGAAVGDSVVLLGKQGDAVITAEDWARWADSISYEMTLGLTGRVRRVYVDNGDAI